MWRGASRCVAGGIHLAETASATEIPQGSVKARVPGGLCTVPFQTSLDASISYPGLDKVNRAMRASRCFCIL